MTIKSTINLSLFTAMIALTANATADGKATYTEACGVCHNIGVAGSPKFGDMDAWKPRIAQGKEVLYEHSIKGKGAMPAKGGRADLSDDAVKAAVDYMVENSSKM